MHSFLQKISQFQLALVNKFMIHLLCELVLTNLAVAHERQQILKAHQVLALTVENARKGCSSKVVTLLSLSPQAWKFGDNYKIS